MVTLAYSTENVWSDKRGEGTGGDRRVFRSTVWLLPLHLVREHCVTLL